MVPLSRKSGNSITPAPLRKLPLPGMAAISLWMLALSVMGVAGVLSGHYPSYGAKVAILTPVSYTHLDVYKRQG